METNIIYTRGANINQMSVCSPALEAMDSWIAERFILHQAHQLDTEWSPLSDSFS